MPDSPPSSISDMSENLAQRVGTRALFSYPHARYFIFFYSSIGGNGTCPGGDIFSHCSSGPPVHFTHQTLTISSFGYLLWRNKRHCYPFYYSKRKVSKRIWTHTLRTSSVMQCYTRRSTHCAIRAVDSSKRGLTNIYLGLNHPRWIGCMQMSTRGLWLAVCKWVRTGVRNCSGINNLAPGGGGGGHFHYWRWWGRAAGQGMIFRSSILTQDI